MENDAVTLCCPNEQCQAPNPLTHKFCQRCATPLPKRYLWVVGDGLNVGSPGEILAQRYLVINQSVVLDTAPGIVPQAPELDNLPAIRPYLRLIPYRIHVPQVYGVLPVVHGQSDKEIFLLEKAPLQIDSTGLQVQLCPELTAAWHDATSLRQLNWLWQIANLWQRFLSEGVASSLLDSNLLRTEGSLIRLLTLRLDTPTAPRLSQLGEFWQQLAANAKPAIAEFMQEISQALIQQRINSPEQLIAVLDQAIADLGHSQTPKIKIFTKTDTGPVRQRNEDACYPPSGTLVSKPPDPRALAIVCDGIGGHEGGNVASNLAIETIRERLEELTSVPTDHTRPSVLLNKLESAVFAANDKISQRNDSEGRNGRQRMGTTLVMALPIAHEIYITHVGDSRAYWITRHGCYQVTLDDDVASREVRLGYAIYREATQQGGSGSLVQALGMSSSTSLHPTGQRFILDEDGVFLLTSDGLSDFDRVEDYWETEILPIITAEADLTTIGERLIEIANTKNGHDNVTIALVHYQVTYVEPQSPLTAVIPESSAYQTVDLATRSAQGTVIQSNFNEKTHAISQPVSARIPKVPLGVIVPAVLVVAVGAIGYWVIHNNVLAPSKSVSNPTSIPTLEPASAPISTAPPTSTPQPTSTKESTQRTVDNLKEGWVIKTKEEITFQNQKKKPLVSGTFLRVEKILPQNKNPQDKVVHLQVCQDNSSNPLQTAKTKEPIKLSQSQLKRFEVNVLPEGQNSPCDNISP
ncbi:MAG: protein phosphatase 2C domain-containing protein [Gloeotrichia echinulata DVL01]|nr:protein phosphatase 2C domain-containing protein [Gloeotrichia echinulata DEX184]